MPIFRPSWKCNNEGKGNPSSPSSARASVPKKKRVDSLAASHAPVPAPKKKAAIPTAPAAPALVVAPVVEPAQKKKAVTPTTAAAPAPAPVVAPVVDSPSKKSKGSGIVMVAGHAPVVSVAPSVETAPREQAVVTDAVSVCDKDVLEERSEEQSEESQNSKEFVEESEEGEDPEESEEQEGVDHHSDQLSEDDKRSKDEGVHDEVAVQGGIAHGNMGQLAVSFSCICILFSIPEIVM
jgi:hypothetical protein